MEQNTYSIKHLVDNPLIAVTLIDKWVTVKTNKELFDGYLITIDPLTGSVVLASFKDDKPVQMSIIIGHSIEAVTVSERTMSAKMKINCDEILQKRKSTERSEEQVMERREKLVKWLKANHIVAEQKDDGSLVVHKVLTIKAPYTKDDCYSSNDIVLNNIQKIIERMPKE